MRLIALLIGLALVPTSAASAKTKGFSYDYKIVKAVHTSSVSESSQHFTGTSTDTWKLGRSDMNGGYLNEGYFGSQPGLGGQGLFSLAEKGTYADAVHTDWTGPGDNSCSLSAPTGSSDYPAVAPAGMMVAIQQKRFGGAVQVAFAQQIADLSNPYFGTGCDNPDTQDPPEEAFISTVKPSVFKKKEFTIVNSGRPGGTAGNTTWKTSITFKRVKTPK